MAWKPRFGLCLRGLRVGLGLRRWRSRSASESSLVAVVGRDSVAGVVGLDFLRELGLDLERAGPPRRIQRGAGPRAIPSLSRSGPRRTHR